MSSRQLRRAQEREALKQARKAADNYLTPDAPLTPPAPQSDSFDSLLNDVLSVAQITANRCNAWKSTGPKSETGKRISSMNAVKTGLTGRTVLLPADDATQYERHVQRFFHDLKPSGDRESELVQSLADTQWRLNRIPGLEMGIYALGRLEFAEEFSSHDPATAALLLESYIFMRHQRELKNLGLQESRLRRQYQKDAAELADLQQKRAAIELSAAQHARHQNPQAVQEVPPPSASTENGFVFSPATPSVPNLSPVAPEPASELLQPVL